MKQLYSWSVATFMACCSMLLNAQWTFNPDQPMTVCNVTGIQKSVKMIADGQGGLLVFWLDTRSGETDLYGQHYNANGTKLWEDDGRLIFHDALNIESFVFQLESYGFSLCWSTTGGTADNPNRLKFQKFDLDAVPIWTQPTIIAEQNTISGQSIGAFESISFIHDDLGYHFGIKIQTYGYYRIRISRVDEDGNLTMPLNGVEIGPISFANLQFCSDQANGAWVAYSAGGAIRVNRIDEFANLVWDNWAYATGTYATGNAFSMIGDSLGVTSAWVTTNNSNDDIAVSRLDTLGAYAWSDDVVMVCSIEGEQNRFDMIQDGDAYYFSWSDSRPGVVGYYAIYGNKIDMQGQILWAEDGIEISNQNTYIPYSKMAISSEGNLISAYGGSIMRAQKHDTDGATLWTPNDLEFCYSSYSQGYENLLMTKSGDGVFCSWVHGSGVSEDGVYIALLDTPMSYVDEFVEACEEYNGYDQVFTESGDYEIQISSDTTIVLHLEIGSASVSSFQASACGSYAWNGTDYTQSGTYTQTFVNDAGCDSIVTLELEISSLSVDISLNGNTLSTSASGGNISWVNCATGAQVASGVNEFTPAENGNYMVVVDDGICNISSDCINVIVANVADWNGQNVLLFPNPATDRFIISGIPANAQKWIVYDAIGKVLDQGSITLGRNFEYDTTNLSEGVYSITLICGSQSISMRWLKN